MVHGEFAAASPCSTKAAASPSGWRNEPTTTARAEHASSHLVLWSDSDLFRALDHYERALAALSEPSLNLRVETLLAMVVCSALVPDQDRATAYHQQLLAVTEPAGDQRYEAHSLFALGLCAWLLGDLRRATTMQHESLRRKREFQDLLGIALVRKTRAQMICRRCEAILFMAGYRVGSVSVRRGRMVCRCGGLGGRVRGGFLG